jgi:hypothetical protein
MFDAYLLGESRAAFAARLDATATFARWAELAPRLSCREGVDSVAGVFAELAPGSAPAYHDQLLGALLQLAAVDGGNDSDAVLAVLHAVAEGATRLARRGFDEGLVLGELTIRIRTYPWRTRQRAVAANLLRDTEHELCREVNPAWMRTRGHLQRVREVAVGRQPWDTVDVPEPGAMQDPPDDDLDLVDVLLWAGRTGVVDARDLSMLIEYHYGRSLTGAGHEHVARVFGVNVRTSKRRCTAALTALQAAAPQYLAS